MGSPATPAPAVRPLRTLVVEDAPGAADPMVAALRASGHEVVRCHGSTPTPEALCDGMFGPCPLDPQGRAPVDVAVLVRGLDAAGVTVAEDGARCAIRARVPLVVVSPGDTAPYTDAAEAVVGPSPLAAVVATEAAAASATHRHVATASEAATEALTLGARPGEVEAEVLDVRVERTGGCLQATITLSGDIGVTRRAHLADRVRGALRAFDRAAPRIDVGVAVVSPTR
jgi:hypothetical protein